MRRRLRPIRSQRRARFRLTWPTIVLPIATVVLLARGEAVRSPLGEGEAAIAIAAQPVRPALAADSGRPPPVAETPLASRAAASAAARFLTSAEYHLRFPGVLAGGAAIAAAMVLGERLFATRVALLASLLLLLLPAGRAMLGTQLGGEPFYLTAMLVALAAIRDVGEARASALVAGAASGAAVAAGGGDGLWLLAMALLWLRSHRGLSRRSLAAVLASALLSLVAISLVSLLWLERSGAWIGGLSPALLFAPQLGRSLGSRASIAWSLVPLLPLVVLGLGALPPRWSANASLRFIALWLGLASLNAAIGGSLIPAIVAWIYAAAMLAVWGIERSRRVITVGAIAAALVLAGLAVRVPAPVRAERTLDRWAVREAGRFLWRTVPAERRIAAAPGARGRLAYYGRRAIDPLPADGGFSGADYLVLSRDDFREALRTLREPAEESGRRRASSLRMVAEFGPWVIARVASAPPTAAPESTADGL